MIVMLLSYVVPPETITAHRAAHVAWLNEGVESGRLLFAGRKVPVTGGMIVVRGTQAEAEAWAATDPFAVHGLAEYQFIEIDPSVIAPGLEAIKG